MRNELTANFLELVDIDNIEDVCDHNMVDISVEDDETFVLSNGLITHNSAVSGITPSRDPEKHGILPLSGKPMNVNGETAKTVLGTKPLSMIMKALGLVIGEKAIRSEMHYGKVYIAADEDADGLNIAALMMNFFYTYWPELFDQNQEPVFYIFNTPFVIARKGKVNKYWYSFNYHEFEPNVYNKSNGWEVTRAKGLASLVEDDWEFSLKNPVLYPILDDDELKESLDLIFNGSRADERKDWIGL